MSAVRQTTTTTTRTNSNNGGGQKGCFCSCSWPFIFAVLDLTVGIMTTVQSCLLMFVGATFRNFVVGLVGLCMGVGILSSTTMTCEFVYNLCFTRFGFFWTWSGRGIFYIVVGCIVATNPEPCCAGLLGFIAFCLCTALGFTYICLECCACMSGSVPGQPSPLCGHPAPAGVGHNDNNGGQQQNQQQAPVKTATQNPFGAPKNDDSVC